MQRRATERIMLERVDGVHLKGRRWELILRLSSWLPALAVLGLIICFSVNVPFWDQWDLVPIIERFRASTLTFGDLFRQHNEHRIPVPLTLQLGLAALSGWDTRWELFASLLIGMCSFVVLRGVLSRTSDILSASERALVGVATSFLVFSAAQWENWLWGWQLSWFLGVFFSLSAVASFTQRSRTALGFAIVGGVLAQFSLGAGAVIWPIGVVMLATLKRWKECSVWTVAGAIAVGVYLIDYSTSPAPTDAGAMQTLSAKTTYALAYLGRPLTVKDGEVAIVASIAVGVLLFIVFVASSWSIWREPMSMRLIASPWIAIGLFAIGSAALTSEARVSLGVHQALSSRYTTVAVLLSIANVVLTWLAVRGRERRLQSRALRAILYAFTAFIMVANTASSLRGVKKMSARQSRLIAGKACLESSTLVDTNCTNSLYHTASIIPARVQYLRSISWGGFDSMKQR